MYDVKLGPGIPIFVDRRSGLESAAIAVLSEEDFCTAQGVIPDLASHFDYQDWLNCREGSNIGLAMAGVDVKMVEIRLSPFIVWCRLTGARPTESALDSFALILADLRDSPAAAALAAVSRREFDAYAPEVEAFGLHTDYAHWRRHRQAVRRGLASSGARVEELPIDTRDFVEWSKCLGESTSEASLDAYAKLLLEFLIEDVRQQ